MLSLSSGVAKASKISLLRPSPLKCDTNRFEIIPTHDHSRIRVPGWRRARSGRRSSGRRTSTRTLTPARTSRPARCPSRCTWRPGPACWCVVQTSNSGHQPRPPPADRRPMFAVWTAKVRTRWRFAALDELADDFEEHAASLLDQCNSKVAVGESSAILLHPPLPLVGASIVMERGCQ